MGYGGAAPRVRGSVVIDLGRRMNKILDINPKDYTCLLEPGVSFYALYEAIQEQDYQHMWIDVPDLGGGSVIGNTLDRGVGVLPTVTIGPCMQASRLCYQQVKSYAPGWAHYQDQPPGRPSHMALGHYMSR